MRNVIKLLLISILFGTNLLALASEGAPKKKHSTQDPVSYTAFLSAIKNNDPESIEYHLVCDKMLLNRVSHDGTSPLHVAAGYSNKKTLEFLISKGANPHQLSSEKLKAIHYAARFKKEENFRYLLSIGSFRDGNYNIPESVQFEQRFRILLKEHEVANIALLSAAKKGYGQTLKSNIGKADLEVRDPQGKTPLLLTAFYGHHDCFETLVGHGASLKAVDVHGSGVYHLAAYGRHTKVLEQLSPKEAIINTMNHSGLNPLALLLSKGEFPDSGAVKALLRLKANPRSRVRQKSQSPLELMKKYLLADAARYVLLSKELERDLAN